MPVLSISSIPRPNRTCETAAIEHERREGPEEKHGHWSRRMKPHGQERSSGDRDAEIVWDALHQTERAGLDSRRMLETERNKDCGRGKRKDRQREPEKRSGLTRAWQRLWRSH